MQKNQESGHRYGEITLFNYIKYIIRLKLILQAVAILPLYLLQLCYGMQSGFPAVLTPQLNSNCCNHSAGFSIDDNEESWIGKLKSIILAQGKPNLT
jgi:hypothetical protein